MSLVVSWVNKQSYMNNLSSLSAVTDICHGRRFFVRLLFELIRCLFLHLAEARILLVLLTLLHCDRPVLSRLLFCTRFALKIHFLIGHVTWAYFFHDRLEKALNFASFLLLIGVSRYLIRLYLHFFLRDAIFGLVRGASVMDKLTLRVLLGYISFVAVLDKLCCRL